MSLSSILIKIDGVDAQLQTVKSKDLVIGFENNTIYSRAQLTLSAINEGPFPGVLLIPGSGSPLICLYVNMVSEMFFEAAKSFSISASICRVNIASPTLKDIAKTTVTVIGTIMTNILRFIMNMDNIRPK